MEDGLELASDGPRVEGVGLDQLHNLLRPLGQALGDEAAVGLEVRIVGDGGEMLQ